VLLAIRGFDGERADLGQVIQTLAGKLPWVGVGAGTGRRLNGRIESVPALAPFESFGSIRPFLPLPVALVCGFTFSSQLILH
jgi:hypothetical protein